MAESKINGWVRVQTTPIPYRAEMIRDILAESGIEAVVLNQNDNNFKFGFADVYVPNDFHQQATWIIENEISFK